MISFLNGIVKSLDNQRIILDVNGVGYSVTVPDEKFFSQGQKIELEIYYYFNQEHGPQLFGFTSHLERQVFSLILSCSGLGPKIGLSILVHMKPEMFLQSIVLDDKQTLSKVSGIGAKKAELMIMQLKDKVSKISIDLFQNKGDALIVKIREVSDALSSLNYSRNEILAALDYVKNNFNIDKLSFDEMLRKSLAYMSKRTNLN